MKKLLVSYQGMLVGELSINKKQYYQFQYHKSWLEQVATFSLSCSLPLQAEAFEHVISYAFFANLIPEGDLRYKIARLLGISERNDFAFLEAIGGEVAGAISLDIKIPTTSEMQEQRDLSPKKLAQVLKQLDSQPFLVNEEGLRLSLAGAQNKLPVIYQNKQFALPLKQTPSTHILKPDPKRSSLPQLAVNEAFCMILAKNCQLKTASIELITIAGQDCLLVQRYDRQNKQRLHQEDFCQAMGIMPSNKYQAEGGPSFADCAKLIMQYSSRPAADKKRLLQWTVFNYLIGNADAHGKNLSFLQQPLRVMSPFYDLLCTAIYPQLTQRISMKIGGENRPQWIMERHWQRYCEETGIAFKMLQREAVSLSGLVLKEAEILAESNDFLKDEEIISKIIDLIKQRKKWLDSRLGV